MTMGCEEKYVPFGIVDEDKGALYLTFGSSFKTSDFIADSLMSWWEKTPAQEGAAIAHIQIKVDNGPKNFGTFRLLRRSGDQWSRGIGSFESVSLRTSFNGLSNA